eukprot:GGOE01049109.1.p2 GENE.GGOE01049109.1~~GGOE01049109.1.p2  ORF type:complete len:131 (-),score=3.57 GGOE01049109.1:66-458(-)
MYTAILPPLSVNRVPLPNVCMSVHFRKRSNMWIQRSGVCTRTAAVHNPMTHLPLEALPLSVAPHGVSVSIHCLCVTLPPSVVPASLTVVSMCPFVVCAFPLCYVGCATPPHTVPTRTFFFPASDEISSFF